MTLFEKVTAAITGIGLIVTAVYVVISAITFRAISKQTAHAEVAANAAKKSAEALLNIERPWVLVDIKSGLEEWFDGYRKNHVGFNWSITNKGNMPAIIVGMNAKMKAIVRENFVSIVDLKNEKFDYGLIEDAFAEGACMVARDETVDCQRGELTPVWTDAQRRIVYERNAVLVAYGIVKYRHTLEPNGVIHETRFLAKYRFVEGGETPFISGSFSRVWDIPEYCKHT